MARQSEQMLHGGTSFFFEHFSSEMSKMRERLDSRCRTAVFRKLLKFCLFGLTDVHSDARGESRNFGVTE